MNFAFVFAFTVNCYKAVSNKMCFLLGAKGDFSQKATQNFNNIDTNLYDKCH